MLALFLVPVIAVAVMGLSYFIIYSLMTQTTVGPSNSIRLIAVMLSFLIPGITSKIFKVKVFQVVMIWIGFTVLAFALDKTVEGNRDNALLVHFLGFQMAATAITTIFISYQLMKQKK